MKAPDFAQRPGSHEALRRCGITPGRGPVAPAENLRTLLAEWTTRPPGAARRVASRTATLPASAPRLSELESGERVACAVARSAPSRTRARTRCRSPDRRRCDLRHCVQGGSGSTTHRSAQVREAVESELLLWGLQCLQRRLDAGIRHLPGIVRETQLKVKPLTRPRRRREGGRTVARPRLCRFDSADSRTSSRPLTSSRSVGNGQLLWAGVTHQLGIQRLAVR